MLLPLHGCETRQAGSHQLLTYQYLPKPGHWAEHDERSLAMPRPVRTAHMWGWVWACALLEHGQSAGSLWPYDEAAKHDRLPQCHLDVPCMRIYKEVTLDLPGRLHVGWRCDSISRVSGQFAEAEKPGRYSSCPACMPQTNWL